MSSPKYTVMQSPKYTFNVSGSTTLAFDCDDVLDANKKFKWTELHARFVFNPDSNTEQHLFGDESTELPVRIGPCGLNLDHQDITHIFYLYDAEKEYQELERTGVRCQHDVNFPIVDNKVHIPFTIYDPEKLTIINSDPDNIDIKLELFFL